MKKQALYILLLSVMWTVAAQAGITNQHIYLNNGTVLDGYIQDQDGLGSYTICYYRATVRIPAAQHPQVTGRQAYPIASLEREWVEWAEANNAFNGSGDDRTLVLCNVSADSGWGATKVRVIEDGLNVKYIEMVPGGRTRDLKPGEFAELKIDKRDRLALSGLDVTYTMRGGREITGQYTGATDSTFSVYSAKEGYEQTYLLADVVKCSYSKINPNQPILVQSELLDVVYTVNAGSIEGVIIEKNFAGKTDNDNVFLVETAGGVRSVKVAEIKKLSRKTNSDYKPQTDILLAEGQVVVNRLSADSVRVKENGNLLYISKMPDAAPSIEAGTNGTSVTVEYHYDGAEAADPFQLIKLKTLELKKNSTVYGFTYKDLVNSVYRPTARETSVNGTTRAEYVVNGTGAFVLYDAKNKVAIPFKVATKK